jgi:hypothetical protein
VRSSSRHRRVMRARDGHGVVCKVVASDSNGNGAQQGERTAGTVHRPRHHLQGALEPYRRGADNIVPVDAGVRVDAKAEPEISKRGGFREGCSRRRGGELGKQAGGASS